MISKYYNKRNVELKADCKKCFGLCCVALYFSAFEGFPENKPAGKPCTNLQKDFTCSVHKQLREKGLKGCISYECIGSGQKVSEITFGGIDWRMDPESSKKMFKVFLIVKQFHEMMWYLAEAYDLQKNEDIKEEIAKLIEETEKFTLLSADSLQNIDVESHRNKVNRFLRDTSEIVRSKAVNLKRNTGTKSSTNSRRIDYFGADLRKAKLVGSDLRGTCLIAANLSGQDLSYADFIGADIRDANLCGANLSKSIFLTQAQLNSAKGDEHTKLPIGVTRPNNW
ncbi:pentapeptide repeat protein [Clostridiales bacterium oral taxon 876 str. F0540]|nr:pentapeptide repeat protein [Clostridiales bacterium oral taxon 876 str. F0540]